MLSNSRYFLVQTISTKLSHILYTLIHTPASKYEYLLVSFSSTRWQRFFVCFLNELYTFNQRLITAIIVLVYAYIQGHLTAVKIFPAFTLIQILNESLMNQVSWTIRTWLEVGVSLNRIQVQTQNALTLSLEYHFCLTVKSKMYLSLSCLLTCVVILLSSVLYN